METEAILSVACPLPLLDQCTGLVATHLDLVESFVGLPSLIGERIFSAGCHTDRFKSDVEYSTQAVRLFTDAYGEEFLSSLSVSGEHLGLNYCLEQLLLFTDLVQLDMSYCGLGDDHEMLAHFQHLHRLEVLSLRGNAVTNIGVQKMTAPYRMFTRGPAGLQMLDLRGNNEISKQSLKYLTKFAFLNTVLFSELSVEKSKSYGCWTLSEEKVDLDIYTEGWAMVLIDRWMIEARQKSVKTKPKPRTGAFSIRKCPLLETSNLCSTGHVAGNQEYRDVMAKRVKVAGIEAACRNESGTDQSQGSKSHLGFQERKMKCDQKQIEDLYKVYGDNKKMTDDNEPLLTRLELCDNKRMNTDKLAGTTFVRSTNKKERIFKGFSVKTAVGREKECSLDIRKDIPIKKNRHVHDIVEKKTSSNHDMRIKGSVKNMKKAEQNSSKISRFFTSTQSVVCKEVISGVDLSENQSVAIVQSVNCDNQSTGNVEFANCDDQSENNKENTSISSINTNSLPGIDSLSTVNTIQVNVKSRKRKRIVIKKNPDAGAVFNCLDETHELESSNENLKNYSINVFQKDLSKEGQQMKKRFKSSLLHSLDGCF